MRTSSTRCNRHNRFQYENGDRLALFVEAARAGLSCYYLCRTSQRQSLFKVPVVFQAISLLILLALAQSGPALSSQSSQSPADEQTLKLRTDLVVVDVLPVQKKTARVVGGLSKDDFTVYEDGVKQQIAHFSRDKLPVSVILLVDRAGCVNPFNEEIRAATIAAINKLKPEDEVAIMTFSNKVALFQPFTRDRRLIADKIMAVERQHQSEQHYFNAAIYEASEYMKRAANPAGRRAIIALTSLEASIDFSKVSEKEALNAVLESGAVVSGLLVKTLGGRIEQAVRGKPTSLLRHLGLRAGSLKMFVEETGGEIIGASPDEIQPALTRLVDNISASYTIAYLPTNTARDGKRRRIRLELSPEVEKREGKVALLARRSYVMAKETEAKRQPSK
ncbi:MAG TPA: VWA domain-containing protein [Blastocatellia bacterium]|nr:VWA domain-containing protein [Blastocatellia bacterium]